MLFFVFDILRLFKGGKRMKTNNYVISLLTAMMIVSQSPVVINANNVKNYQYDSIGNIVKQNESLQADIFNVDFSDGTNDLSPLQNQLGKTIGNPKIIESDELHKNIAKFDGSSAYLYPFNQEKYQNPSLCSWFDHDT